MKLERIASVFLISLFITIVFAEPPPPPRHNNHNQNAKVKHNGPSKIFGWIGSRIAKIPHYFPRIPQFPKYQVPHSLPNYKVSYTHRPTKDHVIMPQPPGSQPQGSYAHRPKNQGHGHGHHHQEPPQHHHQEPPQHHHQEPPQQHYQKPQYSHGHGHQIQDEIVKMKIVQTGPVETHHDHDQVLYDSGNAYIENHNAQVHQAQDFVPIDGHGGDYQQHSSDDYSHQNHQQYSPPQPPKQHVQVQEYRPHNPGNIEVVESQLYYKNHHIVPTDQPGAWENGLAGLSEVHNALPSLVSPVTSTKQTYTEYAVPEYQNVPVYSTSAPQQYQPKPQQVVKHIPITPHSTGPDYFDTAYRSGLEQGKLFLQPSLEIPVKGIENIQQSYASSYFDVQDKGKAHHQGAKQNFDDLDLQGPDLKAIIESIEKNPSQYSGGKAIPPHRDDPNQYSYQKEAPVLVKQLHSVHESPVQQQSHTVHHAPPPSPTPSVQVQHYQSSTAPSYPRQKPQRVRSKPQVQATPEGYVKSGLPGVHIRQTSDAGNSVLEVLADHDAPDFNGHPFDINKLISMIEPGAQLIDTPQISESQSQSESKQSQVVVEPPSSEKAGEIVQNVSSSTEESSSQKSSSNSSGTSYILSESASNYPNFTINPATNFTNQKTNPTPTTTSLTDIVNFFQLTGGKGYIVVEKKVSARQSIDHDLTLPELADGGDDDNFIHDEDDNLDEISRLNLTADNFHQLLQEQSDFDLINSSKMKIIPGIPKPPKYVKSKPIPKPTTPTTTTTTISPYDFISIRSTATPTPTQTTTRHPNHNYDSIITPLTFPKWSYKPLNALLDNFKDTDKDFEMTESGETGVETVQDQIAEESSNIKTIAITVTPPSVLQSTSSDNINSVKNNDFLPTKSPFLYESKSTKQPKPAPVYKPKKQKKTK